MNFREAWELLKRGEKVKLPSWGGYWSWENNTIMMHCKDGSVIDLRETQNMDYTFSNVASDEWMTVDETNTPILGGKISMTFGQAIEAMKRGHRVTRRGWNGKNMSVALQKGYPEGIPCNKNTAQAWGMEEGELFRCRPYLQMKCADGTFQMWLASQSDILADDWKIVE